ncbi:hypothetical protein U9M48_022065 [Paspalum notatum var. saurae]|uniref:Protein TIFY n=1 Tax=Paspalum notatum var. saurae TaxID=547442 RepID=A0AAQ3TL51_PASNO
MELDLLGLGLPPATLAGAPGVAPRPCDKTAVDESLRPDAAAAETPSLPARARVRPRPVDMDDDVPAPPAHMLKPTPTAAAPWPARPSSPKVDLAAGGLGHVAMREFVGSTPPVAAGPTFGFEGSVSAAAARSTPGDDSTAPMTIIYDGSVRVSYRVSMEQAEKILSTVAEHAQAAETLPVQRPADQPQSQADAAAATTSSATQMMIMLWRLAQLEEGLVPKRTASLARFLDKRKQRQAHTTLPLPTHDIILLLSSSISGRRGSINALPSRRAPMDCPLLYPRGIAVVPAQMDTSTKVSARRRAPIGGMGRPLASEDGSMSMEENHGGEVVNTDLKI